LTRLHVIVEGHTEETFVRDVLIDPLALRGVYAQAARVVTGRRRRRIGGHLELQTFKGGLTTYETVRNDIIRWTGQFKGEDDHFTTMFDLYRLPEDFPGYEEATSLNDPVARVIALERALAEDVGDPRFIPYIQLHEFEALLFSDISKLAVAYSDSSRNKAIKNLGAIPGKFDTPEHIDDGQETSPSQRIRKEIPDYHKRSVGPIVAGAIGLPQMMEKCPHFRVWVDVLFALSDG